ncbi:hypothetical protein [Paraburkholderia sp. JPY419]|uniref:hypothetical protein n=1 Tax=Paraburkholderia sp. JPY419 TaxID=667660 RepID=UPI003D25A16D
MIHRARLMALRVVQIIDGAAELFTNSWSRVSIVIICGREAAERAWRAAYAALSGTVSTNGYGGFSTGWGLTFKVRMVRSVKVRICGFWCK